MTPDDIGHFIGNYGFPIFALFAIGLFVNSVFNKVWTWFTKVYSPAVESFKRQELENETMIARAIASMQTLLQQNVATGSTVLETVVKTYELLVLHHDTTGPAASQVAQIVADVEVLKRESIKGLAGELLREIRHQEGNR